MGEIAARTDGVPLFVEELTKAVLEAGTTEAGAAVPASLHASLMARLDRVPGVKEVAQVAACIGREFAYPLLAAVSPVPEAELRAALDRLVAAELVFARGEPPEASYAFKHALVRDAAHESLLKAQRQRLHAGIARALEALVPERTRIEPELLAQHYTEAGLGEPAVRYWLEAARRAAERSANAEAVTHLGEGLALLPLLPAADRERTELDFRITLGTCLVPLRGWAAPETVEAFARARQLCARIGETPHLTTALFGQYLVQLLRAELVAALATAEQLLDRGRELRDVTAMLLGHRAAGVTLTHMGNLSQARDHLERALALYDPSAHGALASSLAFDPAVPCHAYLARCDLHTGRPDHAVARLEAALSIAGSSGHLPTLGFALWQQAALRCELGDRRGTRETVERLLPLTREEGYSVWAAMAVAVGGWAVAEEGDRDAACAEIRRGLEEWQARGQRMMGPFLYGLLADTLRRADRPREALGGLDAAIGMMEATGERLWEPELYRLKGETLTCTGDAAGAEYHLVRALDIARERGGRLMELRAGTSLARLWAGRDRRQEARDLLASICGWFAEGCDTPDLQEAKALLDVLR